MSEIKPENPGRRAETGDQTEKFFGLMGRLIQKAGSLEAAAKLVDKDCDIGASVVMRWFQTGVAPESPAIRNKILGSVEFLATADPQKVSFGPKKLVPPMAPKPKPEASLPAEPEKGSGEK